MGETRRTTTNLAVAALALLGACRSPSSPASRDGQAGSLRCDLASLGLAGAQPVPAWTPPAGCTLNGGGDAAVHSEEEFRARFACAGGVTSGIDFAKSELVMQMRMLSPAGVGGEVVDDGTTVTYVAHFRRNCPDEPHPMPITYPVMFLLPAQHARRFAEASCTVGGEPRCR